MSFRNKTRDDLVTEARDMALALGPTVVRYDTDLSDVTFMKRGDMDNDGTLAELPADHLPPEMMNEPYDPSGYTPTVIYRKDLGEFQECPVALLRELLADPRIDDDWEVGPSPLGNLVLCRFDTGPVGDRWYAGFIDLAMGEVVLYEGDPQPLPRLAANYPFRGPFVRVAEVGHDSTLNAMRPIEHPDEV